MMFTNRYTRSIKRLILVAAVILALGALVPAVSAQSRTHIVQPGETLNIIAGYYGTSWQAIAQANNITNPNRIFVGQRLIIPASGPVVPGPGTTYTVQRGDTLNIIAARFNTTWRAIAQANNLANPSRIFPGQILTIPATGGPGQPPATGGRYVVQPGDNMYRIAARFGVNMWDLARANNILNLNRINSGQVLVIPGR